MSEVISKVAVYGVGHAFIDALSAAIVISAILLQSDPFVSLYIVLIYNFFAFAMQCPLGYLADIMQKPERFAVAGILVGFSALFFQNIPLLLAAIVGTGNALFHLGGGIVVLNLAEKKATLPGIYVAPGAIGLLIGGLIAKNILPFEPLIFVGIVLLILIAVMKPVQLKTWKIKGEFSKFELVILLLLVTVLFRALIGLSLVLPWKADLTLLIILTSAIALGKALGGILGDRFGWRNVALFGLLLSTPILAFAQQIPALIFVGAFLFNFTMPITLTALTNMMPERKGFAFGLTTLALFVGAFPLLIGIRAPSVDIFILIVGIVSIVLINKGLLDYGKFALGKIYKYGERD